MICSVPTCERSLFARGWCGAHYKRSRSAGGLRPEVPIGSLPPVARVFDWDSNLPNPWEATAPEHTCGAAGYLWANEGTLRWFCPPCKLRFAA